MINEKLQYKYYLNLAISIGIYLFFQLLSMDAFYSNLDIMPNILKFKGAAFIIPIIFSGLGYIVTEIYKKEKEFIGIYEAYLVFLAFSYVLMNYLYAPYML